MAAAGTVWAPIALRFLRVAANNVSRTIRTKISSGTSKFQSAQQLRNATSSARQPIHTAAFLRQKRAGRWSSKKAFENVNSTVRRWMSSGGSGAGNASRFDRSQFPSSRVSRTVAQGTGRAPFASTLRPNLTGGALPRTQGGYSFGAGRGGARYFSHSPSAPAQVVQNVGVAMRAFFLSGQKARFDGLNERGDMRYRAVSSLEAEAGNKMSSISRFASGSFIDFQLNPTVTALSPLAAAIPFSTEAAAAMGGDGATLNREGFLDVLTEDFGRSLKELTTVLADLKRLSVLGDLPITMEKNHVLRVRFPGLDAQTAERLCDDVGLQRGVVGQDIEFDADNGFPMALKLPFAPDSPQVDHLMSSPGGSLRSLSGISLEREEDDDSFLDDAFIEAELAENAWLSDPEGYESMSPPMPSSGTHCSQDFEGLEGIYRFMEECDNAKGRYR